MNNTIQLHILMSTLAFGVLCIAAVLAVLLALQEYLLRDKRALGLMTFFPAIERLETWLFRLITVGFVLLTLVVVTSFWFFHNVFTPILWHKTFLALFAWVVFLILLIGRGYFGWRGRTAIRWTLSGVFLVMLAYFGSKLF